MGKLFKRYTWKRIRQAAHLFMKTRDQCDHCCLWCEFFEECKQDYILETLTGRYWWNEDGE